MQDPNKMPEPATQEDREIAALFSDADAAWQEMIAAAEKVQHVADALKKTKLSRAGYDMERALGWHRKEKMQVHMMNLRTFCSKVGIPLHQGTVGKDERGGGAGNDGQSPPDVEMNSLPLHLPATDIPQPVDPLPDVTWESTEPEPQLLPRKKE